MKHSHSAQDHPNTIVGGIIIETFQSCQILHLPELPNPSFDTKSVAFVLGDASFHVFCLEKIRPAG